MKTKIDEYQTTRIWKRTHSRLRFLAGTTGESIVELLDRLSKQELDRLEREETMKNNIFTQSALKAKAEAEARGPIVWVVTGFIDGEAIEPEEYTAMKRYEAETLFKDAHGGYKAHSYRVQIVEKSLIEQNAETNRRNNITNEYMR